MCPFIHFKIRYSLTNLTWHTTELTTQLLTAPLTKTQTDKTKTNNKINKSLLPRPHYCTNYQVSNVLSISQDKRNTNMTAVWGTNVLKNNDTSVV
jgi:predicted HTH transcriptional regulator